MSTIVENKNDAQNKELSQEEIEKALLKQIDFYFSIENLSKDTFLVSKLESGTSYVPISVIASFKLVKQLTEDLELIKKVMKHSKNAHLSKDGTKIKPNVAQTRRTTVILREIEDDVTKKDITVLFDNALEGDKPVEVVKDIGNTWFCKFKTEAQTMTAFKILRTQTIKGNYFGVRIKTENPLIQLLASHNVQFQSQDLGKYSNNQYNPQHYQHNKQVFTGGKYGKNYYPQRGNGAQGGKKKPRYYQGNNYQGGRNYHNNHHNNNNNNYNHHQGGHVGGYKKNRKMVDITAFPNMSESELKSGYPEDVNLVKYRKREFIDVFDNLFDSYLDSRKPIKPIAKSETTKSTEGNKKEEDKKEEVKEEKREETEVKSLLAKPKDFDKFDEVCILQTPNLSLELTKPYYVKPQVISSNKNNNNKSSGNAALVKPKVRKSPKNPIYVVGGENLIYINERNLIMDRPTTPGKKSFAEAAITARDVINPKNEGNVGKKRDIIPKKHHHKKKHHNQAKSNDNNRNNSHHGVSHNSGGGGYSGNSYNDGGSINAKKNFKKKYEKKTTYVSIISGKKQEEEEEEKKKQEKQKREDNQIKKKKKKKKKIVKKEDAKNSNNGDGKRFQGGSNNANKNNNNRGSNNNEQGDLKKKKKNRKRKMSSKEDKGGQKIYTKVNNKKEGKGKEQNQKQSSQKVTKEDTGKGQKVQKQSPQGMTYASIAHASKTAAPKVLPKSGEGKK